MQIFSNEMNLRFCGTPRRCAQTTLQQAGEREKENDTLRTDNEPFVGCPVFFDSLLCWPKTPPSTLAIQPCFDEFNGVQYDKSQNATRFCHTNGTWDTTNYEQCLHIADFNVTVDEFKPSIELSTFIYSAGYILSLAALLMALLVFVYFKELRCLRNTIHGNLFLTYILSVILWILTLTLQISGNSDVTGCIFLVILFHYFSLTNFCWMLVEGLYLYMLVVQTFSGDNLNYRTYAFIGWGCPMIFVTIWAITKSIILHYDVEPIVQPAIECPWMRESEIDMICQIPAAACLIINLVFLIRIMWVLITKLRSANTAETQQYRKATKALLVLIPLLGITYLVVLAGPTEGVGNHIFNAIRAFLISTQGFSVSLFYCFLNSEVKTALRQRFDRWKEQRNIQSSSHRKSNGKTRNYGISYEHSPRSRTESIRLTSSYYVPTSSGGVREGNADNGSGSY